MIRIAVVDDMKISRLGLTLLITEWYFEVILQASSLWELYDNMKTKRLIPEIIIVNLHKSSIDPYSIQKLKALSIVPVYVLINNGDKIDIDYLSGNDHIVSKSVDSAYLKEILVVLSCRN